MFGFRNRTGAKAAATRQASWQHVGMLCSSEDRYIAEAWAMSPSEWSSLSPEARKDYRDRVAFAGRSDGLGRPNA